MVQLSRKPLSKKVYFSILESFQWLVIHLSKHDEVDTFLHDFLSRSERMMLAKRLAIAVLIAKGYSYENIRRVLNVSPATIYKIQQLLETGKGYEMAVKKLAKREEMEKFWREIAHMIGKGYKVFG